MLLFFAFTVASPRDLRSTLFSIMEIALLPETFSVMVASVELLACALNGHLELQRYKILFISGRSSIRLNQNITELDVRRPTPSSSS